MSDFFSDPDAVRKARLILRPVGLVVGVGLAMLWPVVRGFFSRWEPCAQVFSVEEVEALVGGPVGAPEAGTFDSEYFATCEAWYGEPSPFNVEFSAGFGDSEASYGYRARVRSFSAIGEVVRDEPVPALGEGARVAELALESGDHLVMVLLPRPNDGAIEVQQRFPGASSAEARARLIDAVAAKLPAMEPFFRR